MKYKAVLFDLDGTLLDTLQDLATSVNEALNSLGFPQHKIETIKYFIGYGRETLAMRSLPSDHRDDNTLKKLLEGINSEYLRRWTDTTALYQGVPEMLNGLTAARMKMVILSNKPHDFTELSVTKFLSSWHFELVKGALPDLPKKPDPTVALQIARELGLQTSEFIYLGDSDVDMQTALAAGMYPVGAQWGFRTAQELWAGGAKTLIKHPTDLLKLL